jgi:hypothetical protein
MKRAKKYRGPGRTAMEYWQLHGVDHCRELAESAGTTYEYWKRIANLRVRPSIDLARTLAELTGGELTVDKLLPPLSDIRPIGAPPMPGGNRVGAMRRPSLAAA